MSELDPSPKAASKQLPVLDLPEFQWPPLDEEIPTQRLLVLHPGQGDPSDPSNYPRCDLEVVRVDQLPPFIAITNSRGYPGLEFPIEVDGKLLFVTAAMAVFLRHFRMLFNPSVRIWTRYLCLNGDSSEEKKYWTREWSDRMYAMASAKFDMHEFNTSLIEHGIELQVVDPKYMQWTKNWGQRQGPERTIIPTICPVRLGKTRVYSTPDEPVEPIDDFEHVPLDLVTDELRLACLFSASDRSAPLVFNCAHNPMLSEVSYQALSYQWGHDATTSEVTVNGLRLRIRENLAEALRTIRPCEPISVQGHMRVVWIDAVCINQEDVAERTRQVSRMHQIFHFASQVICYVGPETEDSSLAVDLIEILKESIIRESDIGHWRFGEGTYHEETGSFTLATNHLSPEIVAAGFLALYRFLSRSYWRRVWVLQEVAFASDPLVAVGSHIGIPFTHIAQAAYNFECIIQRELGLYSAVLSLDPSLDSLVLENLQFVRKLFYFRHVTSQGQWRELSHTKFAELDPGFLQILIMARNFDATDPRDKIFALWNLPSDKYGLDFKPNYSKPTWEVYMDFAKAWALHSGSLDIISVAESVVSETSRQTALQGEMSSWCPDWSIPFHTSCLTRREYAPRARIADIQSVDGILYSADGGMSNADFATPFFHFEGNVLHCTGIILDTISHFETSIDTIPVGTVLRAGDPRAQTKVRHWSSSLGRYYAAHPQNKIYKDPQRAAWSMFHGDVPSSWILRNDSPSKDRYQDDQQYVPIPRNPFDDDPASSCGTPSRHVTPANDNAVGAWDVAAMNMRGRTPFISEKGYMGLAPRYLGATATPAKRWKLAIIATCSVPIVLYERSDGSYQVMGSCFVQGWMEGEVLMEMVGTDNLRKFWEAKLGSEKLRLSGLDFGFVWTPTQNPEPRNFGRIR